MKIVRCSFLSSLIAQILLQLTLILAVCAGAYAETLRAQLVPGVPWPATDGLGRELPIGAEVGPPRSDRFVGMFYFLWHNQPGNVARKPAGPPDISRILAADPAAAAKPNLPLWGAINEPHYWAQPLFGYYRSTDAWVLRRHASLLADAGIDTLIFDATNAATYPDVYLKLCEVFAAIRKEGRRTPQIAFMVNTAPLETAMQLWQEFYSKGLYRELWFRWQGKPLILCDPKQANDTLRNFFTLRRAHWPFEMINTDRAWHWEATYPQPYGFAGDANQPEQVSVSTAQNLRASDGLVTNMSNGDARGRSFHNGRQDTDPGAVNFGYNFQEQWRRAIELKPPFVLVTGWNEWTAMRFARPDAQITFVDQYNQEFSRDIEPMRGGHGDNYYYQLVANVRRYKGAPGIAPSPSQHSLNATGDMAQWNDIKTAFHDHLGDTLPRDADGVGGVHYRDHTGRNDIVESKVCRDASHTYFWVRTREKLSPTTDPNWMWLLIDSDQNSSTGWNGYDLIVNRRIGRVEINEGGWKWRDSGKVDYSIQGNQLQLTLPNKMFIATGNSLPATFDFKWLDNLQHVDDVMDFYLSGDAAPDGRFRYRCIFK